MSIWEMLQSPRLEGSLEEEETAEGGGLGTRDSGDKEEEEKEEENTFMGRVKGLFRRSFM